MPSAVPCVPRRGRAPANCHATHWVTIRTLARNVSSLLVDVPGNTICHVLTLTMTTPSQAHVATYDGHALTGCQGFCVGSPSAKPTSGHSVGVFTECGLPSDHRLSGFAVCCRRYLSEWMLLQIRGYVLNSAVC